MGQQKTPKRQNNPEGKKSETLPDFKLYHKATIIKTICYWHKNKSAEQNKSPETTPCTYGQLTYDKGVNNIK